MTPPTTPDSIPFPGESRPRPNFLPLLFLVGAGLLVEGALRNSNGESNKDSLIYVTIAAVFALIALTLPRGVRFDRMGEWPLVLLLLAALMSNFGVEFTTPPGVHLIPPNPDYTNHHKLLTLAVVASGALLHPHVRVRRIAFLFLIGVFLALGFWLIQASPSPRIDVTAWHTATYSAFFKGANPYALSMPNPYGHTAWYAPGLATPTTVDVGYPYPPLTMLIGAAGHAVANDYRYANVIAFALGCGFLGLSRSTRVGMLAATLLLFSTKSLFVLEQGWTELSVIGVMGLSLFVLCQERLEKLWPVVYGLLLSVKQYLVFAIPLALLITGVPKQKLQWRGFLFFALKVAAVVALLNVPFFLWGPSDFLRSAVVFQSKQPYRYEALSYMSFLAEGGVPTLPNWLSFALALFGVSVATWRAPRTPSGVAASMGFILLLFFVVAKQAFCNYYFVIEAFFYAAVATWAWNLPPNVRPAGAPDAASPASTADAGTPPRPS